MIKLDNKIDKFLAVVFISGAVLVGVIFANNKGYIKKSNDTRKDDITKKDKIKTKEIVSNKKIDKIEGGKIWLVFEQKELKEGQKFKVKIYGDVAGEKLGVFNVDFKFNPDEMMVDLDEGGRGFSNGKDVIKYISSANTEDLDKGIYKIVEMTVNEHAQGESIHLITIGFEARKDFEIDPNFDWLRVNEMTNDLGRSFDIENICKNIEIR